MQTAGRRLQPPSISHLGTLANLRIIRQTRRSPVQLPLPVSSECGLWLLLLLPPLMTSSARECLGSWPMLMAGPGSLMAGPGSSSGAPPAA